MFVKEEFRGLGIAKYMLTFLANLALERGCGRFEWWCLDWNKRAIDFYISMGAVAMDEWTVYRVTGDNLGSLANLAGLQNAQ